MYKTHLYIRNIIEDTVQSPKTSRVRGIYAIKIEDSTPRSRYMSTSRNG